MCSQTEESIGAVETILQNYRETQNNRYSLHTEKHIPIIVCLNKMDSKKFETENLGNR